MTKICVAALASVAAAGQVSNWAANYCSMSEKLSSQKIQDNPSDMAKVFGEFASLFSETLDCSEDPNNPEIGFDLKGVSLQDCLAAKNKQLKVFKHFELGEFSCLETIADEAAGTGAIWVDVGNTGKFSKKFKVRGAFRFTIEDGVCSSYHVVYDSFNFLGDEASSVKDWAHNYCSMTEKMASQKLQTSKTDMEKLYEDFASLFSETLDCSFDPNNPEVGYDLKGASIQDCFKTYTDKELKHFKHMQYGEDTRCLETIADEATGTGAIWLEIANTGKFSEKVKMRGAFRFTIEEGVCSSFHLVYDTFNRLGDEMLVETPSSGVKVAAAMAFVGALGLVAGMKISQRKKNVLLEHEVTA